MNFLPPTTTATSTAPRTDASHPDAPRVDAPSPNAPRRAGARLGSAGFYWVWGAWVVVCFAVVARAWWMGEAKGWGAWAQWVAGFPLLVWGAARGAKWTKWTEWTGWTKWTSPRATAGVLIAAGLVCRAALLPFAPAQSDDLYRYIWEGRAQLHGFNPYAHAPDAPELAALRDANWARVNHKEYAAIYPPLAQIIFAGLAMGAAVASSVAASISSAAPGSSGWLAIIVFKLFFTACDLGVWAALAAWLRRRGLPAELSLAWGLNPLVIAEFAGSGHLDSLMILTLVLALAEADRGRARAGLAWLSAATAIKLLPIAAAPFFVWVSFRRGPLARTGESRKGFVAPPGQHELRQYRRLALQSRRKPCKCYGRWNLLSLCRLWRANLQFWRTPPSRFNVFALSARVPAALAAVAAPVLALAAGYLIYSGAGPAALTRSLWVYQRDWISNAPAFEWMRDTVFADDGFMARRWLCGALAALGAALWAARVSPLVGVWALLGVYFTLGPVAHPWYLTLFAALACGRRGAWPWLWLTCAAPLAYAAEAAPCGGPLLRLLIWGPFFLGMAVAGAQRRMNSAK